ncbi:MAG TPA: sialidase family protein [Pseudonocardiaceae bacterium]
MTVGTAGAAPADRQVNQVTTGDPYANCTIGAETGTNFPGTLVEPSVSVNPLSHDQFIGLFQQDRWSDGGARGIGEVYANGGGQHVREAAMPFSSCAPGGLSYERASDPWVSFGPDGTAYADALNFDDQGARNGVGAAVSHDGGRTWQHVTELIADTKAEFGDDKNSITADPLRVGTAYAVWDRLDTGPNAATFTGPGFLSVTHDFGRTWSPARVVVPTAQNEQTIGNLIVVDRRTGVLYDVYTDITFTDATGNTPTSSTYKIEHSTDGGRTWSAPSTVATDTSVADIDPNTGAALRTGAGLASVAIDPNNGTLYTAYEGTDFTNGKYNQAQLVHSTDGGRTWSAPTRVNGAPQAEAFTPIVAVDSFGTVALTYYDLRDLPAGDTTTLPTTTWLTTASGPNSAFGGERQLGPVFDLLRAPNAGGFFLGDYEGLAGHGAAVQPLFVGTTGSSGPASTAGFSGLLPVRGWSSATTVTAAAQPVGAATRAGRLRR